MTDLQLPERAENSEPTAPKCWRDILPIHPAAELWPLMAPDELCALGEDLKANGMQVPISILHHEGYALLDGRNRLDALETVGLDVAALLQAAMNWEEIAELKVIYVQPPTGSNSVIASRKADPYDYVVSVNERRRHLSTAQRSEIAAKLLKARPDLSDRAIAKTAQLDHTTVASKHRKLEAGGEIHHPTKRTGRDGKAQSATKTKAQASPGTTALADPLASPEPKPPISEPLPSDPSPSAHPWPVEAERTFRLPDQIPLAQPDLLARYKTALRYIAERAPTIDDARRVAAEALEGRVDHTTVEHTAEVQPEAPSSEIDNIETGVTDEQLAAAKDHVAGTTNRPRQVNIATSSPTTVDELMEIVRAAQAMLASTDTRSTKSTASTG
jgi:hypothetical protein